MHSILKSVALKSESNESYIELHLANDDLVIFGASHSQQKLMPFKQPGRLFLLMQLSRILVLWLMWIEPSWWLLVVATIGWGINMGFTSTLTRTIVQESAAPEFRGRVMSVLTLGMMGSAPIGAIILGIIIERIGTLDALVPAMVLSLILFLYGIARTSIWGYTSPQKS